MSQFFAPERWETPEFMLRCYQPGDGQMLQEAVNASYEHLSPFVPWAKPDYTVEEQEALARYFCARYMTNQEFVLGIFSPDGKRVLGGTGYHLQGDKTDMQMTEIEMWIIASEAGKGLGTQVLQELLHWGFTEWSWVRMEWRCDTLNLASAAVARKGGMTLEGTLRQDRVLNDGTRRDSYIFSVLREEYVRSKTE